MTLRTKLFAGLGLAVALLLAVGVISFRSVRSSADHDRLVVRTHAVLKLLESTLLRLTEAQSASRGFSLTSEERYLKKYHSGLTSLGQDLPALRRLISDDPAQLRRLDALTPLIEQRLALLAESIALYRRAPADEAAQFVPLERGQEVMDQIRSAIVEMEKEESLLLVRRADAATASARQTEIIIVAGTSLALALALIAGLVLRREMAIRQRITDDLARLHRDLQRHAAELDATNKELETFTYSVSHDLRAPLRHIDGFSRILLDDYSASLDPEARSFLGRIRESTQQMGHLVDDLLNLSSVGRQEVRPQITGLKTLVDEVLTGLRPELGDRNIEWHVKDLPFVECDPGLLRQVFANLLSNAVKFTRPRDPAVISVGVVESSDPPVIFVRDNGVGFSMKYAEKLFGVFQRLHRQEDFEGTGVGLATVQRIIHKHGGRIWAEAELDRGATFYFTLNPVRSQPTPEESIQRGAV